MADRPTLTGAEILWATLTGEGVTTVFGYPGGAILPIYDALRFPIHHASSATSRVPPTTSKEKTMPTDLTIPRRPDIPALTSLRFFAALWVAIFHIRDLGVWTGGFRMVSRRRPARLRRRQLLLRPLRLHPGLRLQRTRHPHNSASGKHASPASIPRISSPSRHRSAYASSPPRNEAASRHRPRLHRLPASAGGMVPPHPLFLERSRLEPVGRGYFWTSHFPSSPGSPN